MIAFIYQNTTNLVFDCFGNSAVAGREDRQSACHRFQHGIGNAFLISITARFARVQKNLRRVKKLAQFFLRNEAREIDSAVDLKLARERLQFLKLRSIAGYGESRGWKFFPESGKRADGRLPSFLFNQPNRLQQPPLAVARNIALAKRKIRQWNSGPLNFDLLRGATKINYCLPQRIGTNQNTSDQGYHFLRR